MLCYLGSSAQNTIHERKEGAEKQEDCSVEDFSILDCSLWLINVSETGV